MHRGFRVGGLAIFLALAPLAVTSVQAQQAAAPVADRLDRLERTLRMLQKDVYGGDRPAAAPLTPAPDAGGADGFPAAAAARLEVRVNAIEEEVRRLTGLLEEANHRIDTLADRFDRLSRDVELRFQEIEQKLAAGAAPEPASGRDETAPASPAASSASALSPAPVSNQPGVLGTMPQKALEQRLAESSDPAAPSAGEDSVLVGSTPKEQYDNAFKLIRRGEFAAAEAALKAFIERYPEHDLAGNAKYWLGETYYVREDFERAAITFLEGYQNYHGGNKAPDSLLKLALALSSLEKKKEACAALARLATEFPDASAPIQRRAAAERQRLACE